MKRLLLSALLAAIFLAAAASAAAQDAERVRGELVQVAGGFAALKTRDGRSLKFGLSEATTIFSLRKASFAEVDFGTYVGAVSERMGDDKYSPIVRDSLSWLYRGFELRIIDEKLRGIAVGHTKWDTGPNATMTHGWVDDLEDRVLSIKWGPTDLDETDVEIGVDVPIQRMELGERSLLRPGVPVVVGIEKGADGGFSALFVFVGKDGVVPGL